VGYDEDFSAFVVSSWPLLVRAGRLLAPDPSASEDLVQAALLKTYQRWGSIGEPMAYTRTVLVRLAIRAGRRRWHGETPTQPMPDVVGSDPLALVDSADGVRRALAALPAEQRAVVVLRYYCDLSEADIAAALGCSVGTVKSRAHRALAALRLDPALDHVEVGDE
jgi:RNA polymerase sigma-70 factor (sigma-E family)